MTYLLKSVLITAEVENLVLGEGGQCGESLSAEMRLEREAASDHGGH